MARDHEDYGESAKRDSGPEPEESLNKFYNRKQKVKANKFATDCEAEVAGPDRDADQVENFKDPDASFLNYKKWDRYGGRSK